MLMFWNLNKIIIRENNYLPLDWKSLSSSGRVFVEIGFGNGEFLGYLAKAHPDVLVVGIEVSQLCALKGARLALFNGLENIRIIHGDARFLLSRYFAPETVERVYMNFPCPWPKARHASRRVTVPIFADLLNYLLLPGGFFQLATDVDWYAEETSDTFSNSEAFDIDPIVKNPDRPYLTKYERKWKDMGKDTWLLTLYKNSKILPKGDGVDKWDMEIDAESNKTLVSVLKGFEGAEGKVCEGKGHWIFRDSFISENGIGLLSVITADEGFEQHFYLKVIPSKKGFTIKIDSTGHPYRTPAMKAALHYALDLVTAQ